MIFSRVWILLNFAIVQICAAQPKNYVLSSNYSGVDFFLNFDFFTAVDPTDGYVNYVSESEAISQQLITVEETYVYIGADKTNIASGRGRNSIRLSSKSTWTEGLFIMDLLHMPSVCGAWPAWWLVGNNWPNNGEIDIIEGVNTMTTDLTSLHTSKSCTMALSEDTAFSGTWEVSGTMNASATDCYINAPTESINQGCGINGPEGSFGLPFNENDGGVYALEWTSSYIRSYFFPRSNIPEDITAQIPQVSLWGLPYAEFSLGDNCSSTHFDSMAMTIDLTFCGDWAGGPIFAAQCPGLQNCETFVKNNPSSFSEAYWAIRYIQVYQDSDSNSSFVGTNTDSYDLYSSAGSVALYISVLAACTVIVLSVT